MAVLAWTFNLIHYDVCRWVYTNCLVTTPLLMSSTLCPSTHSHTPSTWGCLGCRPLPINMKCLPPEAPHLHHQIPGYRPDLPNIRRQLRISRVPLAQHVINERLQIPEYRISDMLDVASNGSVLFMSAPGQAIRNEGMLTPRSRWYTARLAHRKTRLYIGSIGGTLGPALASCH